MTLAGRQMERSWRLPTMQVFSSWKLAQILELDWSRNGDADWHSATGQNNQLAKKHWRKLPVLFDSSLT
jgi:hypothetical protein